MSANAAPARLARSTGAVSGLIVLVVGAWAALSPLVGPYFGYAFGTHATWHYSSQRLWLTILPGAAAAIAGVLMMGAATRRSGALAGWLGVAAGAWLVVGPAVSITWHHAGAPIGAPLGGDVRRMAEQVGTFYGAGALIIALVAFATGRFASRPHLEAPVYGNAVYGGAGAAYGGDPVVARNRVPASAAVAAGTTPATVVQPPAREPATAVRAPAGEPATVAQAPAGEPATVAQAPAGEPATVAQAPAGEPATVAQAPAGEPATVAQAPAGEPATVAQAPAQPTSQPATVVEPAAGDPPTAVSPPVERTAASPPRRVARFSAFRRHPRSTIG